MKKILILVFILGAFFAAKAQDAKTSPPAQPQANDLSIEVVKLFRQGKFDEALPVAEKALQIKETQFGRDHIETAKALTNLGFIYSVLNNNKEAEKKLESALEILDKQTALKKEETLLAGDVSERLALIKYSFGKPDMAESLFEKTLLAYEKAGEKDSLKTGKILLSLGSLKSAKRDYGKASSFFEQALAIRVKKVGERNFDTIEAFDNSACALKRADKEKEIKRIQETYFPAAELTEDGDLKWAENKTGDDPKIIESGIVNGKALNLPRPVYPVSARQARASGAVKVRVKINEQGSVVFACGAFNKVHRALIEVSEAAAYSAKFNQTLLKGKPIKVSGTIIYNFTAP